MKVTIKGIINENEYNRWDNYLKKVSQKIRKPYFKDLEFYDVPENDWGRVLSYMYGFNVNFETSPFDRTIHDERDKEIYGESISGSDWYESTYSPDYSEEVTEHNGGYTTKRVYDKNRNITYYENSEGYWERTEFNDDNRITYMENSDGEWERYVYDEKGNEIENYSSKDTINESDDKMDNYLTKVSQRLEKPYFSNLINLFDVPNKNDYWKRIFSKIYNDENIIITQYRDTGVIDRRDDGNRLYYEDEDMGDVYWSEYSYDDKGRKIKRITDTGYWEEWEYDDNDNVIFYNNSGGEWERYVYNEKGDEVSSENYTGYWRRLEYNEDGYMVYYKTSEGTWVKQEVNSDGKVIYREDDKGNITDNRWKYRDNINESINDKQLKYYDKIVDFLLSETEYKVYNTNDGPLVDVLYPMYYGYVITYNIYDISDFMTYTNNWMVGDDDYDYFDHTYGINKEETEYVLNKFISELSPIIYKKMDQIDTRY